MQMSSKREPQGVDIVLRSQISSLKLKAATSRSTLKQDHVLPSNTDVDSQMAVPALRSMSAMRGLLLAEVGDSMVEFDVYGKPGESGDRVGQRIATESLMPPGSSKIGTLPRKTLSAGPVVGSIASLATSATLFDVDVAPVQGGPENS